jgi:hypothetical protein
VDDVKAIVITGLIDQAGLAELAETLAPNRAA